MRKTLLPLILALLLAAVAHSGDPSPSTPRLIEQLGNKDFTKRERASQMLRARGPAVLPALRKALKHPDAEVRRRVGALIPVLEAVAALAPKRITLNAEQQPLTDVLKEIEKQTGYKITAGDVRPNERCTVRLRAVPFWEALERVGAATGHALTVQGIVELSKRQGRSPFVTFSGPFELEIVQLHEDRDLDFTRPGKGKELGQHKHLLRLTVSVLAEPRLMLLSVGDVQVKAAQDEERKPLQSAPPEGHEWRYAFGFRAPFQHHAHIFLCGSSRRSKRIKELRGFIPVNIVVARKRVVVTEKILASKGTGCRIRDGFFTITRAERTDDGCLIEIAVPPVKGCTPDYWRQRFRLEDARGNRYESENWGCLIHASGGQEIVRSIGIRYARRRDPKVGPPSKLIVEDWIRLNHAIPFDFKDVPLP